MYGILDFFQTKLQYFILKIVYSFVIDEIFVEKQG